MKPLTTDDIPACMKQAVALHQGGQLNEARPLYEQVLAADPQHIDANHLLGVVLREAGELPAALRHFDLALQGRSDVAVIWGNRGLARKKMDDPDAALADFQRAHQLDPQEPLHVYHMALCWQAQGHREEALQAYRLVEQLQPQFPGAALNAGILLQELGRHQEALELHRQACAAQPDDPLLRWNMALLCLLLGLYEEGWRLYLERINVPLHREKHPYLTQPPYSNHPEWRGQGPLQGKTIFVYCEQGLGDTLQFLRYVPELAQRGARVVLGVQEPLLRLLHDYPVAHLLQRGEALPPFDLHCSLLSLPAAFGNTLDDLPNTIPYLRALDADVAHWRQRLGPRHKPRVGLVWNGGTHGFSEEQNAINKVRNITFTQIAQLNVPGIDFYSLQKGEHAEADMNHVRAQVWPQNNLHVLTDELHDFADTAGLISQLDLVISVDTSVLHLAAAMGKPVWLLNRMDTCWRWLLGREDSPWYPGVLKQYRQTERGNWDELLQRVRTDLMNKVHPESAPH